MKQMNIFEFMDAEKEEPEFSEATKKIRDIFSVQHRIPRDTLRLYMSAAFKEDISDRKMRAMLENAKNEGFVIGNNQDGQGYYVPETLKELEIIYRQNENRALSILRQQKHIKRKMMEMRE